MCRQFQTAEGNDFANVLKLGDEWTRKIDNDFAKRVLASIEFKRLSLRNVPLTHDLCRKCEQVCEDLFTPALSVTYDWKDLQASATQACKFCQLFLKAYQSRQGAGHSTIAFQRIGSSFMMNGEHSPVLSISRSPDLATGIDQQIQIGHPGLPTDAATTETSFELIREWLNSCDSSHPVCSIDPKITGGRSSSDGLSWIDQLPTRVIAVGKMGDDKVFLRENSPGDRGNWIALSHQWGTGKQFCTTAQNLSTHVSVGIDFELLPATFKHAVAVTRALGQPYLWIDSLCIMQGPGGDFNQEAKRMEQVYSGAYCVLASSRSPGHYAGFLEPREPRDTIVLQQKGRSGSIYISNTVDDFNKHVLNGSLNKRGWVLQEHALARRTIYFTDHQIYFECGDGVRCESLTSMTNERAAFLGDPNFPLIIMKADRGESIIRYQDLYSKYSRLALSNDHDRAMAIDGLQDRIRKALDADGGYGLFDEKDKGRRDRGLLRRSLLWRRGADVVTLPRIHFPKGHPFAKTPSWSWMTCSGGIDYMSPPFAGVDWMELKSPWSSDRPGLENGTQTEEQDGNVTLVAVAREYHSSFLSPGEGEIVFDRPGGSLQPATTSCVVLGVQKGTISMKDKTHYVLLISATNKRDRRGNKVHMRIGAGWLPGKCIGSMTQTVYIH